MDTERRGCSFSRCCLCHQPPVPLRSGGAAPAASVFRERLGLFRKKTALAADGAHAYVSSCRGGPLWKTSHHLQLLPDAPLPRAQPQASAGVSRVGACVHTRPSVCACAPCARTPPPMHAHSLRVHSHPVACLLKGSSDSSGKFSVIAGTLLTPRAQESLASTAAMGRDHGIHEACPHCRRRVTPDGELGLLGGAGLPPACSQCVRGTPRGGAG